jgi:hypothetical protein
MKIPSWKIGAAISGILAQIESAREGTTKVMLGFLVHKVTLSYAFPLSAIRHWNDVTRLS